MPISCQNANRSALPADGELLPLLARRTPLNHSSVPFVLCWSHKAGCTAAVKWFLHHAGLLEEALAFENAGAGLQVHGYENRVLKARPGYLPELAADLRTGKPLVGFLRCPYERCFSSYMILNHGRYLRMQQRGVAHRGIELRRRVLSFVHGDGDDLNRPVSFRDYLHWLQRQDSVALDPHHTPQLTQLQRLLPVQHYRLADFAAATAELERRFGLAGSASASGLFDSGHHRRKVSVGAAETLAFLERGLPLDAFPLAQLPRVTRQLLEGTPFESAIRTLFAEDIAAYEKVAPLRSTTEP